MSNSLLLLLLLGPFQLVPVLVSSQPCSSAVACLAAVIGVPSASDPKSAQQHTSAQPCSTPNALLLLLLGQCCQAAPVPVSTARLAQPLQTPAGKAATRTKHAQTISTCKQHQLGKLHV
jgi:hypothetical protein